MNKTPTSRKGVPSVYLAFVSIRMSETRTRTVHLWSYDDTAWVIAESLQFAGVMAGSPTNVHRWRGPAPSVKDPDQEHMKPGDDMPW